MTKNVGQADSSIRILLGLILLALALFVSSTGWLTVLLFILGMLNIFTGVSGYCALYTLLGINTSKSK